MTSIISAAGLVGFAVLVGTVTVATGAGLLLFLRQRRTHQQTPAPTIAETVEQLRVRKPLDADRHPDPRRSSDLDEQAL